MSSNKKGKVGNRYVCTVDVELPHYVCIKFNFNDKSLHTKNYCEQRRFVNLY